MIMVCEHNAHSWSVSCPSFFSPSTLPASSLYLYTYSLPPSVAHPYSHFFSTRICASVSCRARSKSALVFSFSFSLDFFLFLSLCYATLWSNTTSSKSVNNAFQSKEKRKTRMASYLGHWIRWLHNDDDINRKKRTNTA